jgi:MFS transporter, DHA1 family, multidrug resistance protein
VLASLIGSPKVSTQWTAAATAVHSIIKWRCSPLFWVAMAPTISQAKMIQYCFAFICAFLQMGESLRDTPFGELLRSLGLKTYLYFPEEAENFQAPLFSTVIEATPSKEIENHAEGLEGAVPKSPIVDAPPQEIINRLSSINISAATIVTWYSPEDPENPRNWSDSKKAWVIIVLTVYTFVVYCTASIITPTVEYVMHEFDVTIDVASLGLSLYVVGYGVGPMFFSPISEIPAIGRNPPYLYSFILFFIISVVLAMVRSFPALLVLRFFQGVFGSPVLASGAATIEDIYDIYSAPYGYIWWIAAMYCGPAFGPLFPAWAVADDWRWALWITVIMAGIVMIMLPLVPETSPTKIILHRARRLRKVTKDESYLAPSELKPLNFGANLQIALNKPLEITIKDPAIAFACIYGAIVYATYVRRPLSSRYWL